MNNDTYIKILLEHQMTRNYIGERIKYNVKDKLSTIENNYNRQIQTIKSDNERKFNEEVPRKIMETVPLMLNDSKTMGEILSKQIETLKQELSTRANNIVYNITNEQQHNIVSGAIINNLKERTTIAIREEMNTLTNQRENYKNNCTRELNNIKKEIDNVNNLTKKIENLDSRFTFLNIINIASFGLLVASIFIAVTKKN